MTEDSPLVSVRNLKKYYPIRKGFISRQVGEAKAVDGIDFDIYPGETLGLVGESGCGKSTAAEAIIRLDEPTDGQVIFNSSTWQPDRQQNGNGSVINRLRQLVRPASDEYHVSPETANDVTKFNKRELKAFRRQAQMVMQDPSSSFDPRMTVGQSISEMLMIHGMKDRHLRRSIVEDLLERVGLSADDYDRFPHEFSGGQKQRIGLARALVLNPEFIVADEPVSALDVSIKAEILSLIKDLQEEFGLAVLFISHDLSVIRQVCDRVAVMYLGEIVELAETEILFSDPQHPYTEALLSSIPTPDPNQSLAGIELTGEVPSPESPPVGCRFHTRCHRVIQPEGVDIPQEHWRALVDLAEIAQKELIDPDAIRKSVVSMEDTANEPEDVTKRQFSDRVREEYDLPQTLSNQRLESALEDGVEALYNDDRQGTATIFADAFASPCQAEVPAEVAVTDTHWAKCHLLQSPPTTSSTVDSSHTQ